MTYYLEDADEVLQHFGIKGMQWGVRRQRTSGGSKSKSRPKAKPNRKAGESALRKFGKNPVKEGRRIRAVIETADHVNTKTGEYKNNSKGARTARIVDKTLRAGLGTVIIAGALVASGG